MFRYLESQSNNYYKVIIVGLNIRYTLKLCWEDFIFYATFVTRKNSCDHWVPQKWGSDSVTVFHNNF